MVRFTSPLALLEGGEEAVEEGRGVGREREGTDELLEVWFGVERCSRPVNYHMSPPHTTQYLTHLPVLPLDSLWPGARVKVTLETDTTALFCKDSNYVCVCVWGGGGGGGDRCTIARMQGVTDLECQIPVSGVLWQFNVTLVQLFRPVGT